MDRRPHEAEARRAPDNRRGVAVILALALATTAGYAALGLAGDLRARPVLFLGAHGGMLGAMLLAWRLVRRERRLLRTAVWAALAFRLVAAVGEPGLSDDVYRYVWDGRVQLHGFHPYAWAPDDPRLAALRDADWPRINHPSVKTIYPPLAQVVFAALAALGGGPLPFQLAAGLADFLVVCLVGLLLRRLALPADRVVLYAWNPLAVMESAGSGHVEPLGVLPLLLAGLWIIDRRPALSTLGLAASIQIKLLPAVLLPGFLRRLRPAHALLLFVALAAPVVPYALGGPAWAPGFVDYAERWEHNASIYSGVEWALARVDSGERLKPAVAALERRWGAETLDWERVYRHVWPRSLARLLVALAAVGWLAWLAFRPGLDVIRESLWGLGGVLLLGPTLHPWYLLWVLPWAAVLSSWPWLLLAGLVPLAYLGAGGDVPWGVRVLEFGPPLLLAAACSVRRRAGTPAGGPGGPGELW